jgi:hypothetical protein
MSDSEVAKDGGKSFKEGNYEFNLVDEEYMDKMAAFEVAASDAFLHHAALTSHFSETKAALLTKSPTTAPILPLSRTGGLQRRQGRAYGVSQLRGVLRGNS